MGGSRRLVRPFVALSLLLATLFSTFPLFLLSARFGSLAFPSAERRTTHGVRAYIRIPHRIVNQESNQLGRVALSFGDDVENGGADEKDEEDAADDSYPHEEERPILLLFSAPLTPHSL